MRAKSALCATLERAQRRTRHGTGTGCTVWPPATSSRGGATVLRRGATRGRNGGKGRSAAHLGVALDVPEQPKKKKERWPSSTKKTTQRRGSSSRARYRSSCGELHGGKEEYEVQRASARAHHQGLWRTSPALLTGAAVEGGTGEPLLGGPAPRRDLNARERG